MCPSRLFTLAELREVKPNKPLYYWSLMDTLDLPCLLPTDSSGQNNWTASTLPAEVDRARLALYLIGFSSLLQSTITLPPTILFKLIFLCFLNYFESYLKWSGAVLFWSYLALIFWRCKYGQWPMYSSIDPGPLFSKYLYRLWHHKPLVCIISVHHFYNLLE